MDVINHFLPKLSLIIVIEIFAYFFLNLYKQSLNEAKYFENELTNIESKYLALKFSHQINNNKGVESLILNLAGTDRNSTNMSSKDSEPTISNEKNVNNEALIKMFTEAIKKIK